MNEDLHTYNPYVYCGNNPVGRIDATGLSWDDITNWFNDRWDEVSTWASNTFSGAVYASNSYEGLQLTALYGGIESGISTLRIIAGDNEKPVVFFVQNASEWWKIWEYKAGITLNIGDGGCSVGFGLGEGSASACVGGSSIEVMGGVNKIGITFSQDVDFKK